MNLRPILFQPEMVRAILEGRKVQTRRLTFTPCDGLWVREAFRKDADGYHYRADYPEGSKGWKPSIHMPKAACRLVLPVVSVRREPLQVINYADAVAEGMDPRNLFPWVPFRQLWDSIHGNGDNAWEMDPTVYVVEFRLSGPDEMAGLLAELKGE